MDATERRERAGSEAAEWWALLQGQEMTRAERESFVDWLRDSQTNIAEMLRLFQVHGALGQFREWNEIGTDGPGHVADVIALAGQRPAPRHDAGEWDARRRGRRLLAFAATLAAIAVGGALLLTQWGGQTIVTERGERREVVLEDGSVVQVDPQTRLDVRFEPELRHLRLTAGRAVFRVAKDSNRPFVVMAGDTTVRAVGTAFGVEQRDRDVVIVTVSAGKVAVTSPNLQRNPSPVSLPGTRMEDEPETDGSSLGEVILAANQQITVARADPAPPVRSVDSERELAWAEGRLVFKNDPVAKVVAEFNRYNRIQLTVTDAALAARPISGVFDAAKPEAFIAFIQTAAPVRIERNEGQSIVISPSASR